jgi:hypothetical protein
MLSIFVYAYISFTVFIRPPYDKHQRITLPAEVKNELLCALCVGPLAQTDLRVKFNQNVYGTDASPARAGIVKTHLSENAVRELWRVTEQKGFHTNLCGPATEYLLGVDRALWHDLGVDQALWPDLCPETKDLADTAECSSEAASICAYAAFSNIPPPEQKHEFESKSSIGRALSEGFLYDLCELFKGVGNYSKAHADVGLRVHPGFEIKNGVQQDILDNGVFREIISLLLRRVVRMWHLGPPCKTFGTLRRPRLRSKFSPFGFDPHDPITRGHNLMAVRAAFILWLVHALGLYGSNEQPGSSVMHRMDIFYRLLARGFRKSCW